MKIDHISFTKQEQQNLFDGLAVDADTMISFQPQDFAGNVKHVSISGAQEKLFAVVDEEEGCLRLVNEGEQSTHIIKPTPVNEVLLHRDEMVVNEHLTMQIAKMVFGLNVADCAIIRLADHHPAYIVKRFDVFRTKDGNKNKLYQEDFCTLLGKTAQTHGSDFKYQGSYLEIAKCIRDLLPTWRFEMPGFVSLVIFNFLFSNGDAHLKNFSVLKMQNGKLSLSPAYDLLCTSLHINDAVFALSDGLGLERYSDAYDRTFMPNHDDFYNFALECGLTERQAKKVVSQFVTEKPEITTIVEQSMLSSKCKRIYLRAYHDRLQCLQRNK